MPGPVPRRMDTADRIRLVAGTSCKLDLQLVVRFVEARR